MLCGATLFGSHQCRLHPVWQSFVGLCLPCATPGKEAKHNNYDMRVKLPVYFKPFVDQISRKFFGPHKRPLVLCNDFAQLSMSCFVQKIFDIKSRSRRKTKQVSNVFDPQFLGRDDPRLFCRKLLARCFTVRRLANVWLTSVCWSTSAKPGNKVECRI